MVAFQIGPVTVAWYGIMITCGVIAAMFVAHFEAKRRGLNPDHVLQLMLILLPLGIIGGRLYHVIDQWDEIYRYDPIRVFGGAGLGIFGALIGGALGLIIYTRWQKLNTMQWMDIVAPGVLLAQAIGRWGNFFNQELYGYPTDLPWGLYIDPLHRAAGYENYERFHPLFFYEFLWNIVGAVLLIVLGRKLRDKLLNGDVFFLYAIWYGVGRFYLEGLKIGVWTVGGIPTARWITGIAVIVSISLMIYRHRRRRSGHPTSAPSP